MDLTSSNLITEKTGLTKNEEITLLVDTGADISVSREGKIYSGQILNKENVIRIKGVTNRTTYSIHG